MNTIRQIAILLILLFFMLASCAQEQDEDASYLVNKHVGGMNTSTTVDYEPKIESSCSYDFSEIDALLEEYAAEGAAFGVNIVNRDKVLYRKAFGHYEVDTIRPIFSASKIPAMSVVMSLVDDGYFGLDDHVYNYLEFWPLDKREVTIRHLMTHTSGLPAVAIALCIGQVDLETCVERMSKVPLNGPPGEMFFYGPPGMETVALICEKVTGQTWHELLQERLLDPCDLNAYSMWDDFPLTTSLYVAGGAQTDIADYGTILQMHLSNGMCGENRVLSEWAVKEMQTLQVESNRYGLGWWITRPEEGLSDYEFSDHGGLGAFPLIDTNRGFGFFMLACRGLYYSLDVWEEVRPLLRDMFDSCL